jgi:hypothetical protein
MAFYEPIPALPVTRLVTCRVVPWGLVAVGRIISEDLFTVMIYFESLSFILIQFTSVVNPFVLLKPVKPDHSLFQWLLMRIRTGQKGTPREVLLTDSFD